MYLPAVCIESVDADENGHGSWCSWRDERQVCLLILGFWELYTLSLPIDIELVDWISDFCLEKHFHD